MKLSEFDYDFPKELIAQEPLRKRDTARLMVLDRKKRSITEKVFHGITEYMREGDCLVLNDTRVVPARLYGRRKTGGRVEIFLLGTASDEPRALIRPSKRIKEGEKIELDSGIQVTVLGTANPGRFVRFSAPIDEVLRDGHVPLPPYITRQDNSKDREDYQTVYSCRNGATASPTAGLHFTHELLAGIKDKGVAVTRVTLHTSYGTFAPVAEENIKKHVMHAEYYEVSREAADTINRVKASGGRIFSVGTTSTRVLESAVAETGEVVPSAGETNLFIYPGYRFKIVNNIITNFHLPKSTLLMLVSAFADRDLVFEAYKKAIKARFRFFSYGDAMLIM